MYPDNSIPRQSSAQPNESLATLAAAGRLGLLCACIFSISAVALLAQPNDAQPGRLRPDAPAQHEAARKNIPHLGSSESFMTPRDPEPEPPLDTRIVDAMRMTEDTRSDDFPDIVTNPEDRSEVWMTWASFDGYMDEVRLARYDNSKQRWGTWTQVPGVSGDIWRPRLAFDGLGRVWTIWSQQVDGNFDLYARWYDGTVFGPLHRLTYAEQSDFDHDVAFRNGEIHIAWQAFRGAQSDIFHMAYRDGQWQSETLLSESPRNDWEPAVAVDSKGVAIVAWDTYDKGRYDVLMRRIEEGRLGAIISVAATERLEARPDLAVDSRDRVWVSYEAGRVNWAKDQGRLDPVGTAPGYPIYDWRGIEVAAYAGERKLGMAAPFEIERGEKVYTPDGGPLHHYGRLAIDDQGRLHLLIRNRQGRRLADYWRFFVSTLTAEGWTEPAMLPYSRGRSSMFAAAAPSNDGLWIAWPRDGHPTFSVMVNLPEETVIENVYAARYEPGVPASGPQLEDRAPEVHHRPTAHPNEALDVRRIRGFRARTGGRQLRILRGDTHRHTELSMDLRGSPDGSILDFYRYMLDAAAMDWGFISDHQYGADRSYWWWLTEKVADIFYNEGFASLFGYERSVRYPNGHRNVFHAKRGIQNVPFFVKPDEYMQRHNGIGAVIEGDTKMLYEEIRRTGGMAISHTSATNMGTDWRDNDPYLEPVVEIFQGDRYSYECVGCPFADQGDDYPSAGSAMLEEIHPDGMVAAAWDKGYRLGVIASSDHLSTHMSYAMVYAEDATREGVFDGIRQRHTYAATDNIIVDFRIGDAFMGDEIAVEGEVPAIRATILGTDMVREVALVRNNEVIYAVKPGMREVDFAYTDREPGEGENFYYVRAIQTNDEIAWSSPIWVVRR